MYSQTSLLATFALLTPIAFCIPAQVFKEPRAASPVTCQATPGDAITDYARNPRWGLNMLKCLDKMDNDRWDGADCHPTDSVPGKLVSTDLPTDSVPGFTTGHQVADTPPPADAAVLGPAFKFYKQVNGNGASGQDCFVMCSDCLTKQIDAMQAESTKCIYETASWSCWMGMEVVK